LIPSDDGRSLSELLDGLPPDLASKALSHSSWVEERADSYGRLAFVGDSVLGLTIATQVFDDLPKARSGTLTKILNQAVSQGSVATVARQIGVPERLRELAPTKGDGVDVDTLLASERTIAEVCEGVIGACYLEYGFEVTRQAVIREFAGQIERAQQERVDFKSELQERLARDGATVSYEVIGEAGPAHDRRFEVRARVGGDEVGTGSGRSKKEAEQAAAEMALEGPLGPSATDAGLGRKRPGGARPE
jgi:ribonuclease-3